ncbi:YncE family protein [Chitinophaga sp. 30R24]|uniref:YncE family protein n=1 Tax=Chitinophaga sp. 30R24 TaxID=3248838 RepID=UPI003B9065FD
MMKPLKIIGASFLLALLLITGCRKGDKIVPPVVTPVDTANPHAPYNGIYLLNEGNMGSNKASLDYYDYTTGTYSKNIYGTSNPTAVKDLGDVGNDIQVYGTKLYAVINVSNKVEVMEAATTKRIQQINILNCRYITFANGKGYISSYAGPVKIDPKSPIGFVAEIDTATLQITRKVNVGYQPEEMAVVGDRLYVANSGGYRVPNYDSTVSVIDLNTFTEIKKINVAINLDRLKADDHGNIYVTSRGDYYSVPSDLYVIDTKTDQVTRKFGVAASNICISGDTAYVYGSQFNYTTNTWKISYNMINVNTQTVLNTNFITDGTERSIKMPYGIAVNPATKEIFVTDARDYVSSGTLFCFDKTGIKKWSVATGEIPAHIVFVSGNK